MGREEKRQRVGREEKRREEKRREEKRREEKRREEKRREEKRREERRGEERRGEEKRREERRREEKRREGKKREDPGAQKGRKVAKHGVFTMICGSGGSKSRLAKAAGAEASGQMRDEKLHAVVTRSTFVSENIKTPHVRSTFGS